MDSGTNPSKVQTLLEKLRSFSDRKLLMTSGGEPTKFFIEVYGAKSLDELFKAFTPDDANSIWDAERQKRNPNVNTLLKARMAVAFMEAGKLGMHRRYTENELTARVMGRSYSVFNGYMLDETKHSILIDACK